LSCFTSLLERALCRFVVNGETIRSFNTENILVQTDPITIEFNNLDLARADERASNGVTQIIEGVLQPNWVSNSIFDFVSSSMNDDLSILFGLLVTAGLDNLLNIPFRTSPFTLAAPTNSAFENLGNALLESLSDPANLDTLGRILEYHLIFGVLTLDRLAQGQENNRRFFTLLEANDGRKEVVVPSVVGQTIRINQANVMGQNILLANNGGLYKIDSVLNPDDQANGF
jgi:uncharacterized surface protein with fasciclin (FAS1) repeats